MTHSDELNEGLPREWATKLRDEIVKTIDQKVAETISLLPNEYFENLPEEDLLAHLKALLAVRICDVKQDIILRSTDQRKTTFISHENYAGLLANLIERLSDEGELIGAQIFSSKDKQFVIDVFEFRPQGEKAEIGVVDPSRDSIVQRVVELTKADSKSVSASLVTLPVIV